MGLNNVFSLYGLLETKFLATYFVCLVTQGSPTPEFATYFKGTRPYPGIPAHSPYPPELDFSFSVHPATLSDAPTASPAQHKDRKQMAPAITLLPISDKIMQTFSYLYVVICIVTPCTNNKVI